MKNKNKKNIFMNFYLISMKFSPSPTSINYNWNLGSMIMMIFFFQIISGFLVSLHYDSFMDKAFYSTIHISREVNFGWLVRLIHINGASAYFFLMFLHIMKNINNSSWKFKFTWSSGILILLMSMMVAFMGYVLPWGQMSFWAATVITNLLSAIPYFGKQMVEWIWGGFSVSYPTLSRFYSFHFIFPLVIVMMVMIHIFFLHMYGSSNTVSSPLNLDKISFDPYFSIKDFLGFVMLLFFFMILMMINPFYSVDSENFCEANPMVTPKHIKPEWYFLFAYAILRAIPNKLGGVLGLVFSILILYVKLFQKSKKMKFSMFKKLNSYLFFYSFMILSFLGMKTVEDPYEMLAKLFTLMYFLSVLLL